MAALVPRLGGARRQPADRSDIDEGLRKTSPDPDPGPQAPWGTRGPGERSCVAVTTTPAAPPPWVHPPQHRCQRGLLDKGQVPFAQPAPRAQASCPQSSACRSSAQPQVRSCPLNPRPSPCASTPISAPPALTLPAAQRSCLGGRERLSREEYGPPCLIHGESEKGPSPHLTFSSK